MLLLLLLFFPYESLKKDSVWLICPFLALAMVICPFCILKGDFPKERRLPDSNNRATSKTEAKSESSFYPPQVFDLPDFQSMDARGAKKIYY